MVFALGGASSELVVHGPHLLTATWSLGGVTTAHFTLYNPPPLTPLSPYGLASPSPSKRRADELVLPQETRIRGKTSPVAVLVWMESRPCLIRKFESKLIAYDPPSSLGGLSLQIPQRRRVEAPAYARPGAIS